MKNSELDKARRELNKSHDQISRLIEKEKRELAVILRKASVQSGSASERMNSLSNHEKITARRLAASIIRHQRMNQNLSKMEQGLTKAESLAQKTEDLRRKLAQSHPITHPVSKPIKSRYQAGHEVSDKEFEKLSDEFAADNKSLDAILQRAVRPQAAAVMSAKPVPKSTHTSAAFLKSALPSVPKTKIGDGPKAPSKSHIENQVNQMLKEAEKKVGHEIKDLKEGLISAHKETKSLLGDLKKSVNRWQQQSDKLLKGLPRTLKDVNSVIKEVQSHDSPRTPRRP